MNRKKETTVRMEASTVGRGAESNNMKSYKDKTLDMRYDLMMASLVKHSWISSTFFLISLSCWEELIIFIYINTVQTPWTETSSQT